MHRIPRTIRPSRALPAACLLAILPLTGCSDDGDEGSGTTSTREAATVTTARRVDTTFTGQDSAAFCQYVSTFTEGSQPSPGAPPAEVEADLRASLAAIDEAAAIAPGEIKGDVVTIATIFDALVTDMAAASFDIAQMDPADVEPLQSDAFIDAVTRLQAYLTTVCRTG